MAKSLKLLEGLPLKLQEAILEEISLATQYNEKDSYREINIDGNNYIVHETVLGLIDDLILQLENIEK